MAKTYVYAKKYREGLALYERTLTYAKEALEGYRAVKGKAKVIVLCTLFHPIFEKTMLYRTNVL